MTGAANLAPCALLTFARRRHQSFAACFDPARFWTKFCWHDPTIHGRLYSSYYTIQTSMHNHCSPTTQVSWQQPNNVFRYNCHKTTNTPSKTIRAVKRL